MKCCLLLVYQTKPKTAYILIHTPSFYVYSYLHKTNAHRKFSASLEIMVNATPGRKKNSDDNTSSINELRLRIRLLFPFRLIVVAFFSFFLH